MPTSVPSRTGNTITITNNKPSARDREMMTPPTVADALLRLPPLPPHSTAVAAAATLPTPPNNAS